MQAYKERRLTHTMLTIIGTSHIARESIQKVDKIIRTKKPDIVAIELDAKRLYALLHRGKTKASVRNITALGVKGWLFGTIGALVERRMGSKVGVVPGSDMLQAYKTAKNIGSRCACIDQDISITLKKISKSLTWKERGHFLVDIIKGVFGKTTVTLDLSKVPEKKVVNKLIKEMKQRYPNLYKILVKERNTYMARRLAILMKRNPEKHILAVIGAGHEQEVKKEAQSYLKKIDVPNV